MLLATRAEKLSRDRFVDRNRRHHVMYMRRPSSSKIALIDAYRAVREIRLFSMARVKGAWRVDLLCAGWELCAG